ncbi:MAG: hypothetical protein NWQ17_00245, partial [Polaribacter sp.]|nr:hypothetical protein [Polaribacter sp.]
MNSILQRKCTKQVFLATKIKTFVVLMVMWFFGVTSLCAQEKTVENLKLALIKSKTPTEKIDLQNEIAFLLHRKDSAS